VRLKGLDHGVVSLNRRYLIYLLGYPFSYDVRWDLQEAPIMLLKTMCSILLFAVALPALAASQTGNPDNGPSTGMGTKVLTAAETVKFLPNTVFFRGQSAPIQARNSGGVQFAKDALLLITLVDTAGYSSSVRDKYQAYLITETPINIEGHRLEPGAYGCGFLAANAFVVMDIGGHDLFSVRSSKDADLHRPTPLQVLPSPGGAGYRLYVGRDYVNFAKVAPSTSQTSYLHP